MATNLFAYEPGGSVSSVTNALGGVTTKVYNSKGQPEFQSNPDSSTNGWTYYLDGRLHVQFLPNGNFWETIYNDPQLTVTRYFHNSGGILASNVMVMDRRGNVIQNTDLDGDTSTNFFDGLDRIKTAAGPLIETVTTTGSVPNLTYVTNFTQQIAGYVYDGSGQVTTVSNALGEKTVTTSDPLGRPIRVEVFSASDTSVRVTTTGYSADHNSVTVTNGTGTNAIVTTTYTDTQGHPVLTIGYPTNGIIEYSWQQYDADGNRTAQQQLSSSGGVIATWATNGWTYDGLNRVASETTKDGATTTYGYDALGDVTNRAMPGGLTWSASYLSDGRIAGEQDSNGGSAARSVSYTYYSSGSPFAGRLQTVTDGRGTTRTSTYDDYLRLHTLTTSGSAPEQQMATTNSYSPSGDLLTVYQAFSNSATGPFTSVQRFYDAYHRVTLDAVESSAYFGGAGQTWDLAGRRSSLTVPGTGSFAFAYQADGQMTGVNNTAFTYANNGLLLTRSNSVRNYTVNQRDGRGRVLQATTAANGSTLLAETLNWRNDGRLTNYVASRSDSTETSDTRRYSYSPYAQRLTQESFNVASSQSVTNLYTIDNGTTGGLGILTSQAQSGTLSDTWSVPGSGGLDGLSRVVEATDNVITRPAWGTAVGAASVSATLDGKPVSIQSDGPTSVDGSWRASLSLFPGSHTLSVSAVDPSGLYSGSSNSSFSVGAGATDTITNAYDGNGNVTQRIWVNSSGVTNRVQNLTYDAFDRLIAVTDRDPQNSGINWTAIYDALGRRLRTDSTVVVSNVAMTEDSDGKSEVNTVASFYDPQVEFLEAASDNNGVITYQAYGPDANGVYARIA